MENRIVSVPEKKTSYLLEREQELSVKLNG